MNMIQPSKWSKRVGDAAVCEGRGQDHQELSLTKGGESYEYMDADTDHRRPRADLRRRRIRIQETAEVVVVASRCFLL